MNPELIFVQTDPAFNIVLQALKELKNQNRLQVTHVQAATLTDIESNDDDEARRFKFGGKVKHLTNSAFGRTASAVVRMCMLEAAGVPQSIKWPSVGKNTRRRNEAKLQNPLRDDNNRPLTRNFHLAYNRDKARHYWSKYDQMYPHFLIEDEISRVSLDEEVRRERMMIIVRGNFTEIVEITTTFTCTPRGEQQFDSYIHVICIVSEIAASTGPTEETKDGKFTKQLKEMAPVKMRKEYFEEMTKVEKKTDLIPEWQLLDAFAKLKVGDKNV